MAFEECGLRLEGGGAPTQGLNDAKRELSNAVRVIIQSPLGQQRGMRVDAHAHGTMLFHGGVEAVSETEANRTGGGVRVHRVSSDRIESHSCRERTE